jgi:hypothetical protein
MGEAPDDPRSESLKTEEEILSNAAKELLEMIFVAAAAGPIDDCENWAYGYETDVTDDSDIAVEAKDDNFDYEALNNFFGEEFFAREINTSPDEAWNGSLNGFQSNDVNEEDYDELVELCKKVLVSHDNLEISNFVEYLKIAIKDNQHEMADTEIPALNAWIKFKIEGSFNQPQQQEKQ